MATSVTQLGPTRPDTTSDCPECGGVVRTSNAESYCEDCGLVQHESGIDHGPDWRDYGDDGHNPSRAKAGNLNHPDRGLGSERRTQSHDTDEKRRDRINRNIKSGRKRDRTRSYATTEIHRMTVALDLPEYLGERGKFIFRQLHDDALIGYDLDTMASACLYLACREEDAGLVGSDIEAVARSDERMINRRLHWVANEVGLDVPPPTVASRVRVVAGRLGASTDTTQQAVEYADAIDNGTGASTSALAAAALYAAGDWTQPTISDAANTCPVALRNHRDELPCEGWGK